MKSVFTLIALVLLVGCVTSRPDASAITGTGDWGPVTNGLKCRVTTCRQEYKLSEPVRVLMEVVNSGTSPVSFGWAEVHLSAIQGDKDKPPYFFSTTMHEFPHKTEAGDLAALQPGTRWEKTIVIRPWGPTRSSSPSVASPGSMTLEGSFVYRPDSSSAGKSVASSAVTFEAKK